MWINVYKGRIYWCELVWTIWTYAYLGFNILWASYQIRKIARCNINTTKTNTTKTSNISHTLVDDKIIDHSDVVGAPPVGAGPTTSSF